MTSNQPPAGPPDSAPLSPPMPLGPETKNPVLTLGGYYATPKLRAKKFASDLRKGGLTSFDLADRTEAQQLRKRSDIEFSRTLDLAATAITFSHEQTRRMLLAWTADIIHHEATSIAPDVDLSTGPPGHIFQRLAEAVGAAMRTAKAEQQQAPSARPTAEGTGQGSTPTSDGGPATTKLISPKEKKRRRLRQANFLLLCFVHLSQQRGLTVVEARSGLLEIVSGARKDRSAALQDAIAMVATTPVDRLSRLLNFVSPWESTEREARREAGTAREASSKAQAELADAKEKLAAERAAVGELRGEFERTKRDLRDAQSKALADRQERGAADRETRGRLLRFVTERMRHRIEVLAEALEAEPPAVDVAIKILKELDRDRGEEEQWLTTSA